MHILCNAHNKPNKPENYVSLIKLALRFLSLGFRYFELRNIYQRILNCIRKSTISMLQLKSTFYLHIFEICCHGHRKGYISVIFYFWAKLSCITTQVPYAIYNFTNVTGFDKSQLGSTHQADSFFTTNQ